MSDITREQLEAWKALCEKAARGPWLDRGFVSDGFGLMVQTHDASREFICAARTALPACIARIEKLEDELRLAHALIDAHGMAGDGDVL